ncbi:MAG: terminase [Acidobacteriaceae bacterium]
MKLNLGHGTQEDLIRLGAQLVAGPEPARALTETLLRIRNRLGTCIPLTANKAQQQYLIHRGQKNIVLKARQMGVTTWIAGQFFLKTLLYPGTVTVQVAHTQEAAEALFRIVHRFLAQLPPEWSESPVLKNAKRSSRRIAFPAIDSEYLIETAGDRNAGRGLTITNLHCTELARWPGDPSETFYGLLATLSPAGELAMESTPNGSSGCFWQQWQDAEATGAVRHFFPWWLEDAYTAAPVPEESFSDEERRLVEEHRLSPAQIGYRRQIPANFRGLAKQEYAEDPESCFLSSGSCYFHAPGIDERLRALSGPTQTDLNGDLHTWLVPQPGADYLVAVDPAGGGPDGDFAVAQVIEMKSGLQCAELQSRMEPAELVPAVLKLAHAYNDAILVVERNNQGAAVLALLQSRGYQPLYEQRGKPGWLTTSVSRPDMLGALHSALAETPHLFLSQRLLRECRNFIRLANGRGEARPGEHDDCVMAMAIALAARQEKLSGKALQ